MADFYQKEIWEVERFLREHNVSVPSNFRIALQRAMFVHYCGRNFPSHKCWKSALLCGNFWKQFVREEDYSPIVCKSILSMYRIHASVVSSQPDASSYIGNIVEVIRPIPEHLFTQITESGLLQIAQGFGQAYRTVNTTCINN